MFKQIIFSSIIGAGLAFAGPTMAHHHQHKVQSTTPIVKHAPHKKHRCVSGKKVNYLQAKTNTAS